MCSCALCEIDDENCKSCEDCKNCNGCVCYKCCECCDTKDDDTFDNRTVKLEEVYVVPGSDFEENEKKAKFAEWREKHDIHIIRKTQHSIPHGDPPGDIVDDGVDGKSSSMMKSSQASSISPDDNSLS